MRDGPCAARPVRGTLETVPDAADDDRYRRTVDPRGLAHAVGRDVVLGAGLSAAVLFVVVGLLVPDVAGEERSAWAQSVEEVLLAALVMPVGYWHVRRTVGRRVAAIAAVAANATGSDGGPSLHDVGPSTHDAEADAAAVLELPWRLAVRVARFWTVLAIVVFTYNVLDRTYEWSTLNEAFNASFVLLAGLTAAGATYLIAERRLRPLYPLVLRSAGERGHIGLGLRARLGLAWLLGSGIPVVMIVELVVWRGDGGLDGAIVVLGAVAVVAGATFALVSARGVADPLERLRGAVLRVSAGDLEPTVEVDDATELGQLQAGFNAMTEGLRERRALEDLFGRHVGPEVAKRALSRGVVLGGERREVSALFVDVAGSTELASRTDATDVVRVLNQFFAAVVDVVTAEGGWVNKFHGDGALCVFGAPGEPEGERDHAARALRAARTLRDRLQAIGVDVGIGVSSGTVVAGNVGTEARFEYTVIGDAVNEAARLTEVAKTLPGRVAASGTSVRMAAVPAGWGTAGMVRLRGRSVDTEVYVPS